MKINMRLMEITGKAGAGKTTFSNYLAENSKDIDVIHIDDLLREVKLKYFKLLMKKDKNGEKVRVDSRLKKFIYSNKYIFSIFMKIRAKLIEPLLNKRLKELEGIGIVLIDDIFIKYLKIYDKFEKIYIVERAYKDRIIALTQRNKYKTKEESVAHDIAHNKGNYKEIKEDRRIVRIENKGNKEELRQEARETYLESMLSQREKMISRVKALSPNGLKICQKEEIPRLKKGEFLR